MNQEPEPKIESLETIIKLDRLKCVHSFSKDLKRIRYLGDQCDKCSGYNIMSCMFYSPNNGIYEDHKIANE